MVWFGCGRRKAQMTLISTKCWHPCGKCSYQFAHAYITSSRPLSHTLYSCSSVKSTRYQSCSYLKALGFKEEHIKFSGSSRCPHVYVWGRDMQIILTLAFALFSQSLKRSRVYFTRWLISFFKTGDTYVSFVHLPLFVFFSLLAVAFINTMETIKSDCPDRSLGLNIKSTL